MEYSTIGSGQEISAEGVVYDKESVKEGAIRPLVRLNSGSPVSHANKPLPCGCWKFAGLIGVSKPVLILALIRQAGFVNAAQARRFFAAHLSEAFSLPVTPFS
jgi:hypothetical protein